MNAVANVLPELRGELREGVSMDRYTSWAVGGPADRLYRPADAEDMGAFIASRPADEPITVVGLGSNLLVRDGGVRGSVIALRGRLSALETIAPRRMRAGAGLTCAKLARASADAGLGGGAFFAGIPGTVGGALAMNAGAHGGETWDRVIAVETVGRDGQLHQRTPVDYEIGYRSVVGTGEEWFVSAEFEFAGDPDGKALDEIRNTLAQRTATQPIDQRSCGSVFRNPPGDHAARLIEAAGLKGHRIGGAEVSTKHANFIVNTGQASAADIEALIAHVLAEVQRAHGVVLHPEVRVIGEAAA